MDNFIMILVFIFGVVLTFFSLAQFARQRNDKTKMSLGAIFVLFLIGIGAVGVTTKPIFFGKKQVEGKEVRIILLGGPGAGKGTQGQFISERYHIPAISAGEMLRAVAKENTEQGKRVKEIIDGGNLVPDEMIVGLIEERIKQGDCKNGYLLDGFPRKISQAEALNDAGIDIDYVINIYVPDDVVVERLGGRRVHMDSGRTYHVKYNPPKTPGVDDVTGEPLTQRDDDKEETIRNRLEIYHHKTEPLVKYYQIMSTEGGPHAPKYREVDGSGDIEKIKEQIFSIIDSQ